MPINEEEKGKEFMIRNAFEHFTHKTVEFFIFFKNSIVKFYSSQKILSV